MVGYEDLYAVSNLGRVQRVARTAGTRPDPLLKPGKLKYGHMMVNLHCNGVRKAAYVHVLVLMAFRGPPKTGEECRHLDGDPTNNKLSNLAWGTHKKNMEDSVVHGTSKNRQRGEARKCSKLTKIKVRAVRRRLARGESHRTIAKDYDVTRGAIGRIARGTAWNWLK